MYRLVKLVHGIKCKGFVEMPRAVVGIYIQSGIELRKGLRHLAGFIKLKSLSRNVFGFVVRSKFDIIERHSVALSLRLKTLRRTTNGVSAIKYATVSGFLQASAF